MTILTIRNLTATLLCLRATLILFVLVVPTRTTDDLCTRALPATVDRHDWVRLVDVVLPVRIANTLEALHVLGPLPRECRDLARHLVGGEPPDHQPDEADESENPHANPNLPGREIAEELPHHLEQVPGAKVPQPTHRANVDRLVFDGFAMTVDAKGIERIIETGGSGSIAALHEFSSDEGAVLLSEQHPRLPVHVPRPLHAIEGHQVAQVLERGILGRPTERTLVLPPLHGTITDVAPVVGLARPLHQIQRLLIRDDVFRQLGLSDGGFHGHTLFMANRVTASGALLFVSSVALTTLLFAAVGLLEQVGAVPVKPRRRRRH